jgi:hypothetical protein
MTEHLNALLRQVEDEKPEVATTRNVVFNIVMSGTEARLHISWKHDAVSYHMARVEDFALHKPTDYLDFRKYVRNIIDWGRGERIKDIYNVLEFLDKASMEKSKASKRLQSDVAAINNHPKRRRSARLQAKGTKEIRVTDGHWRAV